MNKDVVLARNILHWSMAASKAYAESVNSKEKKSELLERTRKAQEAVRQNEMYAYEAAGVAPRMLE